MTYTLTERGQGPAYDRDYDNELELMATTREAAVREAQSAGGEGWMINYVLNEYGPDDTQELADDEQDEDTMLVARYEDHPSGRGRWADA